MSAGIACAPACSQDVALEREAANWQAAACYRPSDLSRLRPPLILRGASRASSKPTVASDLTLTRSYG